MELSDATEKTPATPGIDPGTFRLVAQRLNHYATPGLLTKGERHISEDLTYLNTIART
jgi:hypothetical protein